MNSLSYAIPSSITNSLTPMSEGNELIKPIICVTGGSVVIPVNIGETKDISSIGATFMSFRLNGCGSDDSYLGSFAMNGDASKNNPPLISFTGLAVSSTGNITGKYSFNASPVNLSLSAPIAPKTWTYVGANLSGLEFSKNIDSTVVPNLDSTTPAPANTDTALVNGLIKAGMNTFRLPVRWAYLLPYGSDQGEIDDQYYKSFVEPLLISLTKAKINVILDLHSYMRYTPVGKGCAGFCPGDTIINGSQVTESQLVYVWSKLHSRVLGSVNKKGVDLNYLMYDIVNEPMNKKDENLTAKDVAQYEVSVINSLYKISPKQLPNKFLLEVLGWSGLHSFNTFANDQAFSRINLSQLGLTDDVINNKILINVHQYLDSDYSGTQDTCYKDINDPSSGFNLTSFITFLKTNKFKAIVTEFGAGIQGGSTGHMDSTCTTALDGFMKYLQTNAYSDANGYGFVGWTIWSTGHGWFSYNLNVTLTSDQMSILYPYLSGTKPIPPSTDTSLQFILTPEQAGNGCNVQDDTFHNLITNQQGTFTVNVPNSDTTGIVYFYCAVDKWSQHKYQLKVKTKNSVKFCDVYQKVPGSNC